MSSSSQRILALGAAALALGGILAFALADRSPKVESEAPTGLPGRGTQLAKRLQELNDADSVPEKQKAAERYNEDRWGHLVKDVDALPQAGPGGERQYQISKVVVGLKRGGEPLYARITARPSTERYKLVPKDTPLVVGPKIRVKNFEPGPLWGKLKNMNQNLTPDDLPDGMKHLHPDYEEPEADEPESGPSPDSES